MAQAGRERRERGARRRLPGQEPPSGPCRPLCAGQLSGAAPGSGDSVTKDPRGERTTGARARAARAPPTAYATASSMILHDPPWSSSSVLARPRPGRGDPRLAPRRPGLVTRSCALHTHSGDRETLEGAGEGGRSVAEEAWGRSRRVQTVGSQPPGTVRSAGRRDLRGRLAPAPCGPEGCDNSKAEGRWTRDLASEVPWCNG